MEHRLRKEFTQLAMSAVTLLILGMLAAGNTAYIAGTVGEINKSLEFMEEPMSRMGQNGRIGDHELKRGIQGQDSIGQNKSGDKKPPDGSGSENRQPRTQNKDHRMKGRRFWAEKDDKGRISIDGTHDIETEETLKAIAEAASASCCRQ